MKKVSWLFLIAFLSASCRFPAPSPVRAETIDIESLVFEKQDYQTTVPAEAPPACVVDSLMERMSDVCCPLACPARGGYDRSAHVDCVLSMIAESPCTYRDLLLSNRITQCVCSWNPSDPGSAGALRQY